MPSAGSLFPNPVLSRVQFALGLEQDLPVLIRSVIAVNFSIMRTSWCSMQRLCLVPSISPASGPFPLPRCDAALLSVFQRDLYLSVPLSTSPFFDSQPPSHGPKQAVHSRPCPTLKRCNWKTLQLPASPDMPQPRLRKKKKKQTHPKTQPQSTEIRSL